MQVARSMNPRDSCRCSCRPHLSYTTLGIASKALKAILLRLRVTASYEASSGGTAFQILRDEILITTSPHFLGERGVPGVEVALGFRPIGSALAPDISMILSAFTPKWDCPIALLMGGPRLLLAVAGCIPIRTIGNSDCPR